VGFVSNAFTTPVAQRAHRKSGSRSQWIASDLTLKLLGSVGTRLRRGALTPTPGRPFALGELRLELLPVATFPGASALLIEAGGKRHLYTGPVGEGTSHEGALRPADVLCLDATFGDPRFAFPRRADAWADLERQLDEAAGAGRTSILLVALEETSAPLLQAWADSKRVIRAHRAIIEQALALRQAGVPCALPSRFAGKASPADIVLWPMERRDAPQLRRLDGARTILVSGLAGDTDRVQRLGVDAAVAWTPLADHATLMRFARATAATEIATMGAGALAFAAALSAELRCTAYPVVPPQQIGLFAVTSPFEEDRGK